MEGLDGKYVDIGFSGAALIILLALGVCLGLYYLLRKQTNKKMVFAVFALFVIGYAIRLFILLRNPLIYGIDGPWYISQVGHILRDGAMTESTAPLIMYFTAGLSAFAGDVTLGVKVSQAFLSALPILTIWLLARYLTKNDLVSFVAALLLGLSAMTVGMSDVLRNTGALALLPLFYLFFLKFVNGEGRKWTIKIPLKIRKRKFEPTFSSSLVLTFIFFALILGCHYLTAGFAVMTVVAYMMFFTGYRRRIPWQELKFVALLAILMLVVIAASSSLRERILGTAEVMASSDPVPPDLFPFSGAVIPAPGGNGGAESIFMFFVPFIVLALPAMWYTLRHTDRRYMLFTATVLMGLLCAQSWIVYYMYSFRFLIMIYIALFVLMGISIWYLRKHVKKVAAVVLVGVTAFSVFTIVGMGAMAGAWISEEDWTELRGIGRQLPENSIVMTPGMEGLFYWGPLLFEKEMNSTWFPGGPSDLQQLGAQMEHMGQPGMMCLAVVEKDLIEGENLESYGLQIFDNIETERYTVLQAAENSDNSKQRDDGQTGLPVYPGATNLHKSKEDIENYFRGSMDLSSPEISAEAYSTSASYSEVLNWYKTEMSAQGWTVLHEEEDTEYDWGMLYCSSGDDRAHIHTSGNPWGNGNFVIILLEGPASAFGEGPDGGPDGGGPAPLPVATNEIRFNHNPLFAFILLPIELVQALYGTAVYGILKLVVAIPLSVGLIGFLLGLVPILVRKFKKAGSKS